MGYVRQNILVMKYVKQIRLVIRYVRQIRLVTRCDRQIKLVIRYIKQIRFVMIYVRQIGVVMRYIKTNRLVIIYLFLYNVVANWKLAHPNILTNTNIGDLDSRPALTLLELLQIYTEHWSQYWGKPFTNVWPTSTGHIRRLQKYSQP